MHPPCSWRPRSTAAPLSPASASKLPAGTGHRVSRSPAGGKRVRPPPFAWLGWIGSGGDRAGSQAEAALRTGAALEMFHAHGLIHDDVIDAPSTRRGAPVAHVMFADQHRAHRWRGDAEMFGTSAAILVGFLAQCWADDMVRTSGLPMSAQQRVAPVWAELRTEGLCRQLLDNRYRTASYTVERPLHIGAATADADAGLVAACRAFGVDVGIAFQLRDDLLGVFGAPEETGKPSGDDLAQGKHTVPVTAALRYAEDQDPGAAEYLRARIGTRISDEDLSTMRAVITDVGAVEHVDRDIAARTERAVGTLRASTATAPAKDRLAAMAISATQRTS
uniref:polyprenyl synthetase family protein n=1 Tax=Streptomyces anthocyanicus TaxID=68174 RepID=UPI002F9165E2